MPGFNGVLVCLILQKSKDSCRVTELTRSEDYKESNRHFDSAMQTHSQNLVCRYTFESERSLSFFASTTKMGFILIPVFSRYSRSWL